MGVRGNFLVQMISTCHRFAMCSGGGEVGALWARSGGTCFAYLFCNVQCTWYRVRMYTNYNITYSDIYTHRVYSVPGFLSSRPNWLPRPLTSKRVLAPALRFQGRGTLHTRFREGGGGSQIRTKGQTLWYSRYSIIPLRLLKFLKLNRERTSNY